MANVIQAVKAYWPTYVINKGHVLTPTSEFVTRFYNDFLEELLKLIYELTGTRLLIGLEGKGYAPQMVVYLKIAKFFSYVKVFNKVKFTLYDVLNPTSKRTEVLILLCMDFLSFIKSLLENPEIIQALEIKEELLQMTELKDAIKEQINKLSQENAILEDENEKLKARKEQLRSQSSEEMRKKTTIEKDHEIKVTNMEKLAQDNESLEYELKGLQNKCTQLSKLTISQGEYEDLQNRLKCLQKEEGILVKTIESISEKTEKKIHLFEKAKKILSLIKNYSLPIQHLEELMEKEKEMEALEVKKKKQREELESLQKVKEVLMQKIKNLTEEKSKNENDNSKLLFEQQQKLRKLKDIVYHNEIKYKEEKKVWEEKIKEMENVITEDTNDLDKFMESFAEEVSNTEVLLKSLQLPNDLKTDILKYL